MPKCPKCNEQITYLHEYVQWEQKSHFEGVGDQYAMDMCSKEEYEYECPLCGAALFEDPEEAEKFLKGGKDDDQTAKN
jgi:predicted RNA-binding Zn-ribbon protein involved in translation (DUF1610 family)